MSSLLIAAFILTALTLFLIIFFKTNAGVMFLAACTGFVLLGSIDPTVITAAGAVVPSEGEAYIRLTVVLLSMIFAALLFKNTVKGMHLVFHIGIGLVLSLVLVLMLPETTGVSWLLDYVTDPVWSDVNEFRSLIIAAGFGMSLIAIMTTTKKVHRKDKKSKH